MNLTVLGGSAAGPNSGQGCSGYVVEAGATRLVLDLGPGTLPELRRHADYRTLDAIVISHLHPDHVLDLVPLRFLLTYNPEPPPRPLPLWLPPEGYDLLDRLARAFAPDSSADDYFGRVFVIDEYDPRTELTIGEERLAFTPTVHYIPCWAIRVAGPEGRHLVYTADTGPAADLTSFAAGTGVLVAEATMLEPSEEPFAQRGHLTATEAATLARDAGAETLVLTHLWGELGFDAYRQRAARIFDGRIELAQPGLRLTW